MDCYVEQIKRPWIDFNDDSNDGAKKKQLKIEKVDRTKSVTTLEDFSNELIYEIFEYLDFHHAFQSFYNLNERFQNLFIYSNLPIKINLSSISKSTFQHYLTHIITPHTHRIQSFRLSNPLAGDMISLLYPLMTNLTRLTTLVIQNIEANYIDEFINHLSSLPVLSSLTITSIDHTKDQNNIYEKIFRLQGLKYFQMSIETNRFLRSLSNAANQFSSIEHLIIKNKVSFNQINSLLSYVPQLRCLSLKHLDGSNNSRTDKSSNNLNLLTNLSLELYSVSFNDLEFLIINFFRHIKIFRIAIRSPCYSFNSMEYLDADRWERLISNHIPDLSVFDFQHDRNDGYNNDDRNQYESNISKVDSLFWIKRQWFFECQYYRKRWTRATFFYSTNSYRRKYFTLYEKPTTNNYSQDVKFRKDHIRHIHIHNTNAMEQLVSYLPNATELTLSEKFILPLHSIAVSLNRIVPLQQLTVLNLNCHRFAFEKVIEFLQNTPNIRTLELDSILLYGTNSLSIEENEIFQIVSRTNIVTNLTIEQEITLEKLQLIVALFPRLEYLTINLYKEHLESIGRFLLSKFNVNTQHLSLLCISKQRRDLFYILKNLLESENILDDYTIKLINRKVYLWW